jgi:hypothetical protein
MVILMIMFEYGPALQFYVVTAYFWARGLSKVIKIQKKTRLDADYEIREV